MDSSNSQQTQGADSYAGQGTDQGSAYDSMQGGQQQQGSMGGGQGAFGSGVAGGYGSNNSQSQQTAQGQNQNQSQTGEKQDWLDKGIEALGAKAGHNISNSQADSAGDFVNKEFNKYSGRSLPGVQ
ncbi:hypothetical protein DAEQUDRAFT_734112 [Daedalea quercina L-15889]|uniref:Uncharacterized protein n=1 Tax=Daedalea quercina L-15889 TaxID=1314783 RepID=A0A165KII5_9APHY|nr:hypothetical protein DAEQUDRAFT_734112 [Daedalea quercina L-15889]